MSKKPLVNVSHEILQYIDPSKPCKVYRNLHRKCFSVQQGGIVKCHAENVILKNAEFLVSDKGRERVRREKRKSVHAFVKGFVVAASETIKGQLDFGWQKCYYNPYETDYFTECESGRYLKGALFVDLCKNEPILTFSGMYK